MLEETELKIKNLTDFFSRFVCELSRVDFIQNSSRFKVNRNNYNVDNNNENVDNNNENIDNNNENVDNNNENVDKLLTFLKFGRTTPTTSIFESFEYIRNT